MPAFYYGTNGTVAPGTMLGPRSPDVPVMAALDARRPSGVGDRSTAAWAAASIKDATAIAAIRCYSRAAPVPHEAIHVYRVQLSPFHAGPLAVITELRDRLDGAPESPVEALIQQYWRPTGIWHLRELLAASLTVLEEVPATSECDVYIRRWVHYNQDLERARTL